MKWLDPVVLPAEEQLVRQQVQGAPARRRWRSSRSASCHFLASVAKAVNRCPPGVGEPQLRPGVRPFFATMTRIPVGQDDRSGIAVMSATQAPSLTWPSPS